MGKGEHTRVAILDHASALASQVGIAGLTIGRLAEDLDLSKSGLFAHFRSKEALEVQVLEHAADRFVERVVKPALKAPRGVQRIRAVFDRWRRWPEEAGMRGGCIFVSAVAELDDRPGPARDVLVQQQKDWLDVLANVVRTGVSEGELRADTDAEQFAFELYGILLVYHSSSRLLRDRGANARAERAFEALLDRHRAG